MQQKCLTRLVRVKAWQLNSIAGCIFCCVCDLVFAQQSIIQRNLNNSATLFHISIPAQPLVKSLAEFSQLVNQPILYAPSLIDGVVAEPLHGELNAQQALQMLLHGSNFFAERNGEGWIIKLRDAKNNEATVNSIAPLANTEEIIITGYYSKNVQAALNEKKQRTEIIEAIVAEDIEKFPAQNIAEALQHSPGVTVVRDRGEALFVSIRGLPTTFNKVTLNSNTLATNENVRNSGQYGRRFHFDTFPAELVAGVDVIKSSSAEQDEGAIGGSVNIRTFAPFDIAKTTLSLSASLDESELVGNAKPRYSVLASWINPGQTFGYTFSASLAERSLRQDRALNFGWLTTPDIFNHNNELIITPSSFRPTLELEERQRQGATSTLQWKPSDLVSVDVHWLSLTQKINYSEFSYGAVYAVDELLPERNQFFQNALIGGETLSGSTQISRESSGVMDTNHALDITSKWQLADWMLTGNFSTSKARSYNDDPIKRIRLHREDDVSFTFYYPHINGTSVPEIDFQNINLQNANDFYGRRLEWRMTDSNDHEQAWSVKGNYNVDGEWLTSIDVGVKATSHERQYSRKDALIADDFSGKYFTADYYDAFPVDNFLGYTNQHLPTQWLIPNEEKFWSAVDENYLYQKPLTQSDLLNSYNITENSAAIFIKANLENTIAGYDWRGNIGLRAIHTREKSQGYSLQNDSLSAQVFSADYKKLLPSANIVVLFSPQLLWRTAMSSAMTRPDFQDIAPRLTLNSGEELSAVGGNPYLKPVDAIQYDSALEWYFSDMGLLSAGFFYKKLHHFFQNQISSIPINGKTYTLSAMGNGAKARASGLEFAYQQKMNFLPAPFNYFGVETNYTYTNSMADYLTPYGHIYDDLADVAKHSLNLGGYYENQAMSVRLNYSWRAKVLNQVGTANMSAQNTAAFGSLDMHLSYTLTENISLNMDAINLANSAQQDFVADKEFANYTLYGRRFLLGMKWNLF